MKQRLKSFGVALVTILGMILWPVTAYAASGSISLVANRGTVPQGGTLIVAIYMNGGGTPIYGVESDIAFPSSKLQYVGFSANGSAFEISATNGGSDGLATIARGTVNPVSGSALVGTVTFRALVSSGSASISVAGSSSLSDGNGNPVPYGPGNTNVNFGVVASGSGAAAPASAPADTAKDTTPPTITNIKAKDITPYTATITWTTNEPADSVVEYGLDTNYGLGASVGTQTTTHEVLLNSSFITPKTVFHYRIKTTDGSGNVQTSPDQTVAIPGVPITIVVRSADGKPQAGALVTLDNDTGMTDQNGSVTLASGVGNKKITTSFDGVTLVKPITVTKTAKKLPPVQLALNRTPVDRWMYTSVMLSLVILALLAFDSVIFGSRYFAKIFRIRVHKPQLATANDAVATPVLTEEPQPAAETEVEAAPEPPAVQSAPGTPRYTTIRPLDLEPDLNLKAAANIPLAQLVNNIPRPTPSIDGVRPPMPATQEVVEKTPPPAPAPKAIQITHFADAEPAEPAAVPAEVTVETAKPVEKIEKPAAPKKTRRVKKTTSKKK